MARLSASGKGKNATTPEPTRRKSASSITSTKKRKVDWSKIDQEKIFEGFTLHAVKPAKTKTSRNSTPSTKKHKSGKAGTVESETYNDAPMDADIVQKNPFEDGELRETHYKVQPSLEWESTSRYRRFTSKSGLLLFTSSKLHIAGA